MAEYNSRDYQGEPFQGSVSTRKVTPEEVAYRDGYVHGRALVDHEQDPLQTVARRQDEARQVDLARQERRLRTEADNYIASGLVLGLFIALLAGLVGGLMYYLTRQNEDDVIIQPQTQELVPTATQGQAQVTPDANIPDVDIVVPTPQSPPPNAVDTNNNRVDDTTPGGTTGGSTTAPGTTAPAGTTNGTTTNGTTTNGTTTNGTTTDGTVAPDGSSIQVPTQTPSQQTVPLGVQQFPQQNNSTGTGQGTSAP